MGHAMKQAGFVVTLVPMSTSMYSGDDDKSPNQIMRNEYVKYRKQTSLGQQVDLLDLADGILLQWYSGFDAALCENTYSPSSKACTCVSLADILECFWQFLPIHLPYSLPGLWQECHHA